MALEFPKTSSENGSNENSIEKTFEIRHKVVDELQKELFNSDQVFSFCLEGADAQGIVDEYSDIDMRVFVNKGSVDEVINSIESIISKDSPIDFKTEINRPESKTRQILFHIKGTSKFLIMDVMVQEYSDAMKIKDNEKKVLFDKKNILVENERTPVKLNERVLARAEDIESKAAFRSIYLERELARDHYLESVNQYQTFVLKKLVEALRLLYCPQKSDLYLKNLSTDLPAEIVTEIEDLYRVNTLNEIKEKKGKADILLKKTLDELKTKYN
jgi:hypothetical protein